MYISNYIVDLAYTTSIITFLLAIHLCFITKKILLLFIFCPESIITSFEKLLRLFFISITILEAQWAEPVSLTFHSALRKLDTEPPIGASHQVLVIWLNSYKEEDI